MPQRAPKFSIILAAGKGTRMRSATRHKVCFLIDGKPAINRAIETYNACGIKQHIVVVGAMAGQVVETVGSEFENVIFTYQAEQLGTAHAARVGIKTLLALDSNQDVLVVAGDKIIEAVALEQLFDVFYSGNCDLALLACPKHEGSSQGRIVQTENGQLLAIVEVADIRQRMVYRNIRTLIESGKKLSAEELVKIIHDGFFGRGAVREEKKLAKAFGKLWHTVAVEKHDPSPEELLKWIPEELTRFEFTIQSGASLVKMPEEIENMPLVNNSIYLVKAPVLQYALERLDRNNAQQEEYLSGVVGILARARDENMPRFRVQALRIDNQNYVMGYNNPTELLEIEAYIQSRKRKRVPPEIPASLWYRTISEWREDFDSLLKTNGAQARKLWDELTTLYGDDIKVIKERISAYQEILSCAANIFNSNDRVLIVRSPARLNVMGRHIDHQGGNCNLMTIGYETLMVVHPRSDDKIFLHNLDKERFGTREFSISELIMDLPWDDWLSLVNSEKISRLIRTHSSDWSQYVMATVLRLQKKFTNTKLRGMDIVVSGNIPIAAGLSSSSSLVVATAEATIAVNRLDIFPAQFVDLCGEGEWFTGTREVNTDYAAVKFGQKGKVIKVSFFDFALEDIVPFPENYVMAICDSGIRAQDNSNARNMFNHRISCYRIGLKLIRKNFPQYAPLINHLRDVNVRNLRIPLSWIYKILLHLPEEATQEQLQEMLPDEDLEPIFATHQPPEDGLYPIRGVVLFGLAECERARLYAGLLKSNHFSEIGRMMNVSHNGDRVATFSASGEKQPFLSPTSNTYLLNLIEDLESGDPERVMRAQLQWQPGKYSCSLPAIDRMVDIALRTKGVVGAQLAGPGLGGCMMVLARRNAVQKLIENLTKQYYEPMGKSASVLVCRPVAGSGVLMADI